MLGIFFIILELLSLLLNLEIVPQEKGINIRLITMNVNGQSGILHSLPKNNFLLKTLDDNDPEASIVVVNLNELNNRSWVVSFFANWFLSPSFVSAAKKRGYRIVSSDLSMRTGLLILQKFSCPNILNLKAAKGSFSPLKPYKYIKGYVLISFRYLRKSFVFIGAHFPAHFYKLSERNSALKDIERAVKIADYDHCFLLGDLNYRLDKSLSSQPNLRSVYGSYRYRREGKKDKTIIKNFNESVMEEFKEWEESPGKELEENPLLAYDQFNYSLKYASNLDWQEMKIGFSPTYKLLKGNTLHGEKEKKGFDNSRRVGYTDRIVWASKEVKDSGDVIGLRYYSITSEELNIDSDHDGVVLDVRVIA